MALDGGLFSTRLAPDRAYPAAALAFMNERSLHGKVLGEFGWGEYLIWHAAPQDKIFIDGTAIPIKKPPCRFAHSAIKAARSVDNCRAQAGRG
jgi:hypothetical protein